MEPETDYEQRLDGSGGCEDTRITFVERFQRYVMTYTALSPTGPRIALAASIFPRHSSRGNRLPGSVPMPGGGSRS